MPVLLLLAIALTAALTGGFAVWRYPRPAKPLTSATLDTARKVGQAARRHLRVRAFMSARLDPAAATGLLLTLAMFVAIGGGVLLGALAYLTRTNSDLTGIDNGVAKWGNRHASTTSTHVINAVTQLGGIYTIVALCLVLAVVVTIRERTIWITPFILVVMGGDELITGTVKQLADRLRPTFNPAAATLGPSFPSGHSATAAAFYATAALLIGRRSSRTTRAVLAGLAIGLAVAVAASRVLLDLHWLTDVIAGLALGWAWFAACAIAFGGRILRFGAAAENAAHAAGAPTALEDRSSARKRRSLA
jgi:membrane-associated phospholipid phosphatase